jgi:hypothetical protein
MIINTYMFLIVTGPRTYLKMAYVYYRRGSTMMNHVLFRSISFFPAFLLCSLRIYARASTFTYCRGYRIDTSIYVHICTYSHPRPSLFVNERREEINYWMAGLGIIVSFLYHRSYSALYRYCILQYYVRVRVII